MRTLSHESLDATLKMELSSDNIPSHREDYRHGVKHASLRALSNHFRSRTGRTPVEYAALCQSRR